MPGELDVLLSRSRELGIRPHIGVRAKLSVKASGHWTDSGGERSTFGLSPAQIVDVVDKLKACDMLDCFRLLHYHLGSQVSNIRDIRTGVMEGARLYVGLVQEGAHGRPTWAAAWPWTTTARTPPHLVAQLQSGRIQRRHRGSHHEHLQ